MNARSLVLPLLAASLVCAAGCANNETVKPVQAPATQPTSGVVASNTTDKSSENVYVSKDITRACKIEFNDASKAPKFDFDQSALQASDRAVLEKVASCLTTGALKGRAIKLVGRADPRGENEYNMALGEHRANSAGDYLAKLGVEHGKMTQTSRGELDATGHNETDWQRDRRVDILLLQ